MIDINKFISKHVINRTSSMFSNDILHNEDILKKQINDQSVLVIGGAGTIGSSYIKALLQFCPKSLVVVIKKYVSLQVWVKNCNNWRKNS